MTYLYIAFSVFVFLYCVRYLQVFSLAFFAVLLSVTVLLVVKPLWHPAVQGLLLFLFLFPLCRLFYLLVDELLSVKSAMKSGRWAVGLKKILILWLPFPLFAYIGYIAIDTRNAEVYKKVNLAVYSATISPIIYACSEQGYLVCHCHESDNSKNNACPVYPFVQELTQNNFVLQSDLHYTLARLKKTFAEDISFRFEQSLSKVNKAIEKSGGNVNDVLFTGRSPLVHKSLSGYHPDLAAPGCDGVIDQFFALEKCVKNYMLDPLNKAYDDMRNDMQLLVADTLGDANSLSDDTKVQLESMLDEIILQRVSTYERSAHQALYNAFKTLRFIDVLLFGIWLLIAVYALVVGLLYMLTRFVYNQNLGGVLFHLGRDYISDKAILVSDITVDDGMNSFSQALNETTWYACVDSSLRYDVDGIPCIPKPLSLFLRRLPHRYVMFRFSPKENKAAVSAHANDLTRFIKISLLDGQEVSFRFSSLVAFSENVELKALVDLRLSAFFDGQLFFSIARGPGEIIIRTDGGKPEIMSDDNVKPSDPRDLIVFDTQGSYSLVADMNPVSVYFLGHRVTPSKGSVVIRQPPDAKNSFSSRAATVRRMLYLLLPLTLLILLPILL
jgi:hypothetical protein